MSAFDQALIQEVLSLGATKAAIIDPSTIAITDEIRSICEKNGCGRDGTNWCCPPGIGTLPELRERVAGFAKGLLFQCIRPLEDSFDLEGMEEAGRDHARVVAQMAARMRENPALPRILPLGAGGCSLCKRCAYLDGKPCVRPQEAISSVEAYGMHVPMLLEGTGMQYTNGANTVSYVGLILYDDQGGDAQGR